MQRVLVTWVVTLTPDIHVRDHSPSSTEPNLLVACIWLSPGTLWWHTGSQPPWRSSQTRLRLWWPGSRASTCFLMTNHSTLQHSPMRQSLARYVWRSSTHQLRQPQEPQSVMLPIEHGLFSSDVSLLSRREEICSLTTNRRLPDPISQGIFVGFSRDLSRIVRC